MEEKALFEWSNKVTKKYVSKDLSQEIHDKAAPFLTWLQEAEEEDSEPEEEDDDLEVNVCFINNLYFYTIPNYTYKLYICFCYRLNMTIEPNSR